MVADSEPDVLIVHLNWEFYRREAWASGRTRAQAEGYGVRLGGAVDGLQRGTVPNACPGIRAQAMLLGASSALWSGHLYCR